VYIDLGMVYLLWVSKYAFREVSIYQDACSQR